MGPLNGLRLRFANMIPGLGGGSELNAAEDSVSMVRGLRGTICSGNVPLVGVAGSTFTLACGLRAILMDEVPVGEAREPDVEEIEDALERECW
jgi:hypothetical protein